MSEEEILVVKKGEGNNRIKFKLVKRHNAGWSPNRYEKVITSKDYNQIAFLFYDLYSMGYDIRKAYEKFKSMLNEPELFFLK